MSAKPRRLATNLDATAVGHDRRPLADRHSANISSIAFHRVLHRPICSPSLSALNGLVAEFGRRGAEEPPKFAEPGIFPIRPDRSVYFAAVQSMPFARPHGSEILSANLILKNDDFARAEA